MLESIKVIQEVKSVKEANRRLEDGWVLLFITGSISFILGHRG